MKGLVLIVTIFGLATAAEDRTVLEYLQQSSNYTVLSKLLQDAGLTNTLPSLAPYTVLAPTDLAFSKVGLVLLTSLQNDVSQLVKVLEYHVISGYLLVPMVHGSLVKTTLEGQDVTISSTLIFGKPLSFNNQAYLVGTGDIICKDGVIQPIDTLLVPPVVEHLNIAQILLKKDDKFKDITLAFMIGGLTSLLSSNTGDYTVFAPVDSAFVAYSSNLLHPGRTNASYIYHEVLKYHIVPGERMSAVLQNGSILTLHGTTVNITKTATGIKVNNAHVIEADIGATNGVIHAIDDVLIPPEFLPGHRR